MTTTNGTRAILPASRPTVVIGAFANREPTRWAFPTTRPIHLVCAGTDGLISYEDALLAGFPRLQDMGGTLGTTRPRSPGLWSAIDRIAHGDRRRPLGPLPRCRAGRGGQPRLRARAWPRTSTPPRSSTAPSIVARAPA